MITALYLAIAGGALAMTWAYAVREEAVVFTAAMAFGAWSLLAVTPELTSPSGGSTVTIAVGPARWLFAALAVLSGVALVGAVIGIYPESHPDQQFSEVTN